MRSLRRSACAAGWELVGVPCGYLAGKVVFICLRAFVVLLERTRAVRTRIAVELNALRHVASFVPDGPRGPVSPTNCPPF